MPTLGINTPKIQSKEKKEKFDSFCYKFMIYEHEIPIGSRLYFGKNAKIKRKIENTASEILSLEGFEEIVTPFLSYHQHESIDESELIRFSDKENNIVSLRADSTMDVVRLLTKRIGKDKIEKKCFYIQPVFTYPSAEHYQIGAESLGSADLAEPIKISAKIYEKLHLKPLLHISNINIPKIISKELGLPISFFKNGNLEKMLKINLPWLNKLAYMHKASDMDEVLDEAPAPIKNELIKMKKLCDSIDYENVVYSPLYYAKMRYYDDLFFRFIQKNKTLGTGGSYKNENVKSTGFAIYTDSLIEELSKI